MISTLGIISLVVAVISIYALYLHHKLMKYRTAVDTALTNLELSQEQDDHSTSLEHVKAYNAATRQYNSHIDQFPAKAMALLVGFKKEEYIELN